MLRVSEGEWPVCVLRGGCRLREEGCRYLQLDDEVHVLAILIRVHQLHNVGVTESGKVPRVMATQTNPRHTSFSGDSHYS